MGAYRIHADDGRYVDIHDAELERFLSSSLSDGAVRIVESDAAYVGSRLAELLGWREHP